MKFDLSQGTSAGGATAGLVAPAAVALLKADNSVNVDIQSLQHILLFGIKGVAAYADHAQILGQEDDNVYAFVQEEPGAISAGVHYTQCLERAGAELYD